MTDDKKLKAFQMYSKYYNVDKERFDNALGSEEGRKKIYQGLDKYYSKLPSFEDFESILTGNSFDAAEYEKQQKIKQVAIDSNPLDPLGIGHKVVNAITQLFTGGEILARDPIGYTETIGRELNKSLVESNMAIQDPYFGTIGLDPTRLTEKQKESFKAENDKRLHQLYTKTANIRNEIKTRYRDLGLMDHTETFWDQQFESLGMNMPMMLVGGGAAKFGLTTTGNIIKAVGIPLFAFAEASTHAGDMYSQTAKKDKKGNVIEGTGSLEDARQSIPFGLLAGSLEFLGVSQAVDMIGALSKSSLKELGWGFVGKQAGKVSLTEAGEEITQNTVEQVDMMLQGYQKQFDFAQVGEAALGGAVGGLMLGGFAIGTSYKDLTNLKDYAKKLDTKLDKMVKEKVITQEKADSYKKVTTALNETPIEELKPAIENVNEVMKNVDKDIKTVAGEKAWPKALEKATNSSGKFFAALESKPFSEALNEITPESDEQEIYKQRIRKTTQYQNIYQTKFKAAKAEFGELNDMQLARIEEESYKEFAVNKSGKMNGIFIQEFFNDEVVAAHEEIINNIEDPDERAKVKKTNPEKASPMQKRTEEEITSQNPLQPEGKKESVIEGVFETTETREDLATGIKLSDFKDADIYWEENDQQGDFTYSNVIESNENTAEPSFEGQMTFDYGDSKRGDITSTSTIEAIEKKERTATTRYESDGNIDYWKKAKVGDIVRFKGKNGKTILVKITKPLTKLDSNTTAAEWSKKEGWSEKYFNEKVKPKLNQAYQIEYEPVTQSSAPADSKSLANQLESSGNFDHNLKPIVDWMLSKLNPEVRVVDSNHILKDKKSGKSFKFGSARGAVAIEDGKFVVYMNKDAKGTDSKSPYRTLAHELFHAITIPALHNNRAFKGQIAQFMGTLRESMLESEFYKENAERLDALFANDTEFLSAVIGNTFPELKRWMEESKVPDKPRSTFMQWLKNIFRNMIDKATGQRMNPSFYNSLEFILEDNLGIESSFTRYIKNIKIDETDYIGEDLVERLDKAFQAVEFDSEDPRVIRTAVELLAEGEDISDYVAFMQSLQLEEVLSRLRENEMWNKRALHFYNDHYKKEFKTFEDYTDAIVRQMYNYAKSLREMPAVRLVVTTTENSKNTELIDLGPVYQDKNGRTVYSYKEDVKLFEAIPQLEDLFKVEFEINYVDELKEQSVDENGNMSIRWKKISEIDVEDPDSKKNIKNEKYGKEFESRGYLYPGTWSDKKSLFVFKMVKTEDGQKIPLEINPEMFEPIKHLYNERIKKFAFDYLNKIDKEKGKIVYDMYQNEENQGKLDVLIQNVFGDSDKAQELREYLSKSKLTPSQLLRMVLEDIRLGGKIVNGQLNSVLFDANRPDTYDAIRMYKRPTLVSPKRFVDEQEPFIQSVLDSLEMKEHGIKIKNGKAVTKAFIFDSATKAGQITFKYKDKEYDLGKLLVDTFGDETTDGKIFYVLGGFDNFWRKMHGSIKKGSIKAWIGNRIAGNEFTSPFYIKGAYHGINKNEILAEWMRANGITLLISSSAAKVNSYETGNAFDGQPKTFDVPFADIHRDLEKGKVKDGAKGLQQTILANFITPDNEGFEDSGWFKAIENLTTALSDRFKDTMNAINPAEIVRFMKDKALTATSDYEKVISELVIDLLYTSSDKDYADKKKEFLTVKDTLTSREKAEFRKKIESYKIKNLVINQEMAEKIGSFFHEPYFAKTVKDWINKELEKLINFQTPSTWAVLDSDMGYLTQQRYELIEKYINEAHSIAQYNSIMPRLLKDFKRLNKNILGLEDELLRLRKGFDTAESEKSKAKILENIERAEKELESYQAELDLIPLDDDGRIDRSKIELTKLEEKEFQKRLEEIVDLETGKLKEGYTLITKDIADYYKIRTGDNIMHVCVPSDSVLSANGSKVVGIMNEDISEPGKIILNSEYIQGVVGKDFDIDTILIIPYTDIFTPSQYQDMITSLQKSLEKHKSKMLATYRDKLSGNYFDIKDPRTGTSKRVQGRNLEFKDILKKEVRLRFTQLENGISEGRSLFNPLHEGFKILNEYTKDIGKIVNRRKMLTLKSQMGFSTTLIDKEGTKFNINPNHSKAWDNYLLLLNLTNDMVDMPTNTNKFFYYYNKIKAYDQDNGTEFFEHWVLANKQGKKNDEAVVKILQNVERFLFSYGARLTTDYNLDVFGENRELEDVLGYIATQQKLNKLMDSKGKTKEQYDADKQELLKEYLLKNRKASELEKRVAGQYITNMQVKDTNQSPIMRLINEFDLDGLPAIEMNEDTYIRTHSDAIVSMLNSPEWKEIKKELFEQYDKFPRYQGRDKSEAEIEAEKKQNKANGMEWKNEFIEKRVGLRQGVYDIKDGFTNNDLVLALHLLTTQNMDLHYLKAKLIVLVNPVKQALLNPKKEMGIYVEDIYQKANEDVYPMIVRKMFENNKITEFTGKKTEIKLKSVVGDISMKIEDGKLFVYYKSAKQKTKIHRFTPEEIGTGINTHAKTLRRALYNEIFANAENRKEFSSMVYMGGKNVSISDRMELAADMLKQQLKPFSKEQRIRFWTSLLGQPNTLRHPLNLVLPYKMKTGAFNSQDRLWQLITMVKDNVAKNILREFAQNFQKVYKGPEFWQSMKIKNYIKSEDVFNSENGTQIWFEESIKKQVALDKLEDEDPTIGSAWDTIFDIHRKDEQFAATAGSSLGKSFNVFTGMIEDITPLDVTQTVSAYVTKIQGKVSNSLLALTKAIGIGHGVNQMTTKENVRDTLIDTYVKDIEEYVARTPNEVVETHVTHINNIIESNPLKVTITTNPLSREYIYHTSTGTYTDKTIEDLFNDKNVPEGIARTKHLIAFEYHKRYSVDAIEYLENVVDYLDLTLRTLPAGFDKYDEIKNMRFKYWNLLQRFNKMAFKYMPRVYTKSDYENLWKSHNRDRVKTRVIEMIKREQDARARGQKEVALYADLVTQQEVDDQIERELAEEFGSLKVDRYGDFVHSFEMKREINDPHAGYIKNSFEPHKRHSRQFRNMILNDLYYLDYLQFEYNAAQLGSKPEIVKRVKRWYKMISGHRMLKTKAVDYKEIKAGDEISFFVLMREKQGRYEEVPLRGKVASVSPDKVFMEMNRKEMRNAIQDRIERLRTQTLAKGTKANITQKYELENLQSDGYLQTIPSNMTVQQAQDLLIEGYFNKLADETNWGVYKFDEIYTKQYNGIQIEKKAGVRVSTVKHTTTDEVLDITNKLASGLLLGGPQAGARNWIDANWALMKDLRLILYFKKLFQARKFVSEFRSFVGNPKEFDIYEKVTSKLAKANAVLSNPSATGKQLELVNAIATKFALENGLGKLNHLGSLVANDDQDTIDLTKTQEMIRKGIDIPKNALMSFFNRAESGVRLKASYLYAYKAIMVDRLTSSKDIEMAIQKGVARTQSLYESIYRRLGEDTKGGALALKFIQYNTFQLEIKKQEREQIKRMGGFKFSDIFRRKATFTDANGNTTTHKAGDSIDPNIANRLAVDLWVDTIGVTLSVLYPGFRASNPINRLAIMAIVQVAIGALRGETPDEWDLKDWLFSIASFWVGLGVTLPVQMIGYISGKFGQPIPLITQGKDDPIFPLNPRVGQTLIQSLSAGVSAITGEDESSSFKYYTGDTWYKVGLFEKSLIGFNFLTPTRRSYYSDKVNEFQGADPFKKPWKLAIDEVAGIGPAPNIEFFIPIINVMKYK